MGRPSLFTAARTQAILQAVRIGQPRSRACLMGGVDYTTLCAWAASGEKEGKGPYFEFSYNLKRAEAEGELALLATIKTQSRTQWTAAAWLLERKFPQDYGRKDRVSLEAGPEGGSAVLEIHLPKKQELPDAVQEQSPGPENAGNEPGVVQPVDGGDARLRQPARAPGKARKGPPRGKGKGKATPAHRAKA